MTMAAAPSLCSHLLTMAASLFSRRARKRVAGLLGMAASMEAQRALAILVSRWTASREGRCAGVVSNLGSILSADACFGSGSVILVGFDAPGPFWLRREDRPRTSFCIATAAVSASASMASSVASFAPARAFTRTSCPPAVSVLSRTSRTAWWRAVSIGPAVPRGLGQRVALTPSRSFYVRSHAALVARRIRKFRGSLCQLVGRSVLLPCVNRTSPRSAF